MKKSTPPHGITGYSRRRCRCGVCISAHRDYQREYRRGLVAGERGTALLEKHRERQRAANRRLYLVPESHRKMLVATRRWQDRRKATLKKMKGDPCADCGLVFPPECMDWDHRHGTLKVFNIGGSATRPWKDILAEIAKCDLVCANCHRIRTTTRRKERQREKASRGT